MAIVNNSDYLYYGYVINDDNLNVSLINNFKMSKYTIINFDNRFLHPTY